MSEILKVAVIGGGFSGLVAAEVLSEKLGAGVAVFEKNDRAGKKILATGNGRGNISNEEIRVEKYHSVAGAGVGYAIGRYGNDSIKEYFYRLGVPTRTEDGKIYPSSFQASAISDALRQKIASCDCEISTGCEVLSLSRKNGVFALKTSSGEYCAQNVIFACGGKAGRQYGTDGSAYSLLKPFGHDATALFPSLVQLKTRTEHIKGLKGVKVNACVSLLDGNKIISEIQGDLLFTEYGVSGNTVFFLSSYAAGREGLAISADFLPEKSEKELADYLTYKSTLSHIDGDILGGIINKQLGRAVVKRACPDGYTADKAADLARAVKNFRLEITGSLGFDYAQVTRGGIEFSGVNEKTFESKMATGLFIVGEALDVDGDCGGYNLQWAYSSARCAAEEILKRV